MSWPAMSAPLSCPIIAICCEDGRTSELGESECRPKPLSGAACCSNAPAGGGGGVARSSGWSSCCGAPCCCRTVAGRGFLRAREILAGERGGTEARMSCRSKVSGRHRLAKRSKHQSIKSSARLRRERALLAGAENGRARPLLGARRERGAVVLVLVVAAEAGAAAARGCALVHSGLSVLRLPRQAGALAQLRCARPAALVAALVLEELARTFRAPRQAGRVLAELWLLLLLLGLRQLGICLLALHLLQVDGRGHMVCKLLVLLLLQQLVGGSGRRRRRARGRRPFLGPALRRRVHARTSV